jgi:hypothetical protein
VIEKQGRLTEALPRERGGYFFMKKQQPALFPFV